jgi:hypothetical protein
MTIQEIIADAQKLHDNIDRAVAAANALNQLAPRLNLARGCLNVALGYLHSHAADNPPAPAPIPGTATNPPSGPG